MKAVRLMAIALLTSLAAILVFSSAAGHRLAHESPTVIFDYDVTNDYGILFADEFERLGGAEALGYPASYRFRLDDGFVYQVTQGALLQWRPEVRKAYLGNTFEMLEKAGYDQWLLDTKGIPLPIKEDGSGGDWNKARQTRLAWLTNENIKAKYLANPNPEGIASWSEARAIELYGLPMSYPEKHGPFVSQRFQRVAFQLWVDEVEGMPAVGTVVRVLGGDLLKEACLVPSHALAPAERSSCASSTITLPKFTLAPLSSAFTLPGLSLGSPPASNPPPASDPPPSKGSSDPPPQSDQPRSDPTQVPDPPQQQDPPQEQDPPKQQDPPQQQDPPSPTIEISGLGTSMRVGTSTSFTVNATNLDSSKSYSIQVSTSNSNLGFDGGCTDQQEDATVSAGDTSHTSTLTLRACTTGGGIVTATLLHDGASVDTDTHSLTVTTPPRVVTPPTPAIRIAGLVSTMERGDNAPFTVTASNLVSSASYDIQVSTNNANVGFDAGCADQEDDVTVPAGDTSHTSTFTLHACSTAGGIVTATLLSDGQEIASNAQNVTVNGPALALEGLVESMEAGESVTFTLRASSLDSSISYRIQVGINFDAIGFSSDCVDFAKNFTVPANSASHTETLTLYACASGAARLAAYLYVDNRQVAQAWQDVTVSVPPPKIEISDLVSSFTEGETERFEVTADKLDSSETYKILLTSSNGAVGFHAYCSIDRDERSVPANRTSYSFSPRLKACATPGATVKATLLLADDTEVISATQYVTVQPDLSPKIAMWGFFGIYKVGAGHSPFTVSASHLDSSKTYKIKMTMEDDESGDRIGISFDSGCSQQEKEIAVPAGRTSYTEQLNLEACDATSGTVTAKLLFADGSEVDSARNIATNNVTVGQDIRPRLYGPNNVTRGSSKKLGFTLAGLDSTRTYTVLFETSAAGLGFNSNCSVKSATKSVTGKTYYTVTAEDFTGSDTLYGCTGAGGRVTAKVYVGGSVQPNPHRTEYHTVSVRNN